MFTKKTKYSHIKKNFFPVMPSYHKKKNNFTFLFRFTRKHHYTAFTQLQEWSPRSQIFRHWHPPIHSLKNKKITRFILSSYHKHTCKKIYNLNFPVHNTLAAIPLSEILTNPLLSPPKNIMFIVSLQFL